MAKSAIKVTVVMICCIHWVLAGLHKYISEVVLAWRFVSDSNPWVVVLALGVSRMLLSQ